MEFILFATLNALYSMSAQHIDQLLIKGNFVLDPCAAAMNNGFFVMSNPFLE